jgi:hypothetical protein
VLLKTQKKENHLYIFRMKYTPEQDILKWITDYVEVNHEFYDYKFPPCPYAKSARLRGLIDIVAYSSNSKSLFIKNQIYDLIDKKIFDVRILVFPSAVKWYFHLHLYIRSINKKIIKQDYYIQYGRVFDTEIPYFIVIVNKLSNVLSAHQSLLPTEYYKSWTKKHYKNVVTRRSNMYKKYGIF